MISRSPEALRISLRIEALSVLKANPFHPFEGKISPLNSYQKKWHESITATTRDELRNAALPLEKMKFSDAENLRLGELVSRANIFYDALSARIPKEHPHYPSARLDWNSEVAAKLALAVEHLFGERKNLNILHVGCGFGPVAAFLQMELKQKFLGLEIDKNSTDLAKRMGFEFVTQGKIQEMPWPSESFDAIISWHVFCKDYPWLFLPPKNEEETDIILNEVRYNNDTFLYHFIKISGDVLERLRPGGYLISYNESYVNSATTAPYFERFIQSQEDPNLAAIQKPLSQLAV